MVILVRAGIDESPCMELAPYAHQVGGHVAVMSLDKHTICKPHIDKEYKFYKDLPRDLSRFVPKFKGIADVVVKQARDGYLHLVAYPYLRRGSNSSYEDAESTDEWSNHKKHDKMLGCCPYKTQQRLQKPLYKVRLSQGGSVSIDQDSDSDDLFEDMSTESGYRRFGCNPWSMHCHRQQIAKMQKDDRDDQSHKFLLLENVTDKFLHPCILDLKIGLRSYDDDATEEKKKSQIAKIQSTTSAKLGIRACGMQIYRPDKGHFICRNKYYGRRLTEDGLRRTVEEFVFNGQRLRLDVIAAIVKEIKGLMETLSKLDSYRFYGSSLLLIYEGSENLSATNDGGGYFAQKEHFTAGRNSNHCSQEGNMVHTDTQTEQDTGFQEEPLHSKVVDFRGDGMTADTARTSDSETDSWSERSGDTSETESPIPGSGNTAQRFGSSLNHSTAWDERGEQARKYQRIDSASSIPDQEASHDRTRLSSVGHSNHGDGGQLVHIKMIDFAHTKFNEHSKEMGQASQTGAPQGPDSDFMYGLENLLRIFRTILDENS